MKRLFFAAFFFFLLIASLFVSDLFIDPTKNEFTEVFVGIDVAYNDIEGLKALIDEISSYTNTFVIGSTGITYNITKLNDVCNYVYNNGMYFMIYMHPQNEIDKLEGQRQWVETARIKWNQHFLGLYAYDEVGGRQLDNATYRVLNEAVANYTNAAEKYVIQLNNNLAHIRGEPINAGNMTLFTSDYALYWFDYKGGYDVVFAEFGWNYSRQLNAALCRGAATAQNKEWGVMITWTYNHPPYIESGLKLYEDMLLAYENGAKYIIVFDTNENYTEGILKEEHFKALEEFWQYSQTNPRDNPQIEQKVAYVLPKDYGYGFRGPGDKIWGLWETTNLSIEMSYHLGSYIEEYGYNLDIIYGSEIRINEIYSKYIFWNGIIVTNP